MRATAAACFAMLLIGVFPDGAGAARDATLSVFVNGTERREWTAFDGAASLRTVLHSGWREQIHDGPTPVDLVLFDGMGHQIAGGNDDRLPHQKMKNTPDAVGQALSFFLDRPMP